MHINADETVLFYKCDPAKPIHLKGEQCKGRISELVRANMDGSENLKCLVIGKFQNPRCLENVKSLRVHYYANSPAWMNSEMFNDWVRLLVKKLNSNVEKFFYLVIIVQYILKLKTCNSSLSIDIPPTLLLYPSNGSGHSITLLLSEK